MPLSFPVLTRTPDGGWIATCRKCGWTSTSTAVKAAADYSRRIHGPEATCTNGRES